MSVLDFSAVSEAAHDVAARMAGLTLPDMFRRLVLDEPEIKRLAEPVIREDSAHRDVFSDGRFPGIYVVFEWPLHITAEELADDFWRTGMFILEEYDSERSEAVKQVCRAIVGRLVLIRTVLIDGLIEAHGTFARTGEFRSIHRLQWMRPALRIDIKSGDVLEDTGDGSVVQWSGVVFERPTKSADRFAGYHEGSEILRESGSKFHVNSTEHDGVRPSLRRRASAPWQSVEAAIAALWPDGIPAGLAPKSRDARIIDWQKENGLTTASTKTIQRVLQCTKVPRDS